jgi:hypothetical protein
MTAIQLHVFAEGLPSGNKDDVYATLKIMHDIDDPIELGKTEVIANSRSPEWTEPIILPEYREGTPVKVVVSVYTAPRNESVGSLLFDINDVLHAPGGVIGKEFMDGGMIGLYAEPITDTSVLKLQLRGIDLKNTERLGIFRNSDPFFEIQRSRVHSAKPNEQVWKTIYRSPSIASNLNPIWNETDLKMCVLCGSNRGKSFELHCLILMKKVIIHLWVQQK